MRLVYRSISAPMLGELAVTALRIVREEHLDGVLLGPKSIPRLLELGLVVDGPKGKVEALDAKLQKALRSKKIPYVRREVSVVRPGPPIPVSSAVPEELGARVATVGGEPQPHAAPTAAAPLAPPTIVNEVRVPEQAPTPVNVNVNPTPVNVAAPVVHVPAPQVQIEQAPATPVNVTVEPAPPTEVNVHLPEMQAPPVNVQVDAPIVNVPAPIVNVQAPNVLIPEVLPPQVHVSTPEPKVLVEIQALPAPVVNVNIGDALDRLGQLILGALKEAGQNQKAPTIQVNVPEIKVPEVKIPPTPAPQVTVNLPPPVRVKKVITRDGQGRIQSVEEIPEKAQ